MINHARGSVFLGAIALLVSVSLYFQPTVEAAALANISQESSQEELNNQQNNQSNQQDKSLIQQDNKTTQEQSKNLISEEKTEVKTEVISDSNSFRATAYCLKGRTASGGSVRRGIVAADPRVLPLGSRIQINAGAYSGTYTVTDTGGAVKGRKLDIWVPNCSEAIRFGRRTISVSRLGKKS